MGMAIRGMEYCLVREVGIPFTSCPMSKMSPCWNAKLFRRVVPFLERATNR